MVFFSVLYNPTDNCIENIRRASKHGVRQVVYLNCVDDFFLNELNNTDAIILGCNANVGLGIAFYEFEEFMTANNYNYFIYFDQDTIVEDIAWTNILNGYESHFRKNGVGMLHYSSGVLKGSSVVINSGCLFSMEIIKTVGFHDRTYFVEGLDYEFSLRLKIFGYEISYISCDGIDHESLQDGFSRRILFFTIPLRIYSKNRVMDFNHSHRRLLLIALKNKMFGSFLFFLKSFIKMNIMQKFSRLFKS